MAELAALLQCALSGEPATSPLLEALVPACGGDMDTAVDKDIARNDQPCRITPQEVRGPGATTIQHENDDIQHASALASGKVSA